MKTSNFEQTPLHAEIFYQKINGMQHIILNKGIKYSCVVL